jgi:hypothetical protein
VLHHLETRGLLISVDANRPVDDIAGDILEALTVPTLDLSQSDAHVEYAGRVRLSRGVALVVGQREHTRDVPTGFGKRQTGGGGLVIPGLDRPGLSRRYSVFAARAMASRLTWSCPRAASRIRRCRSRRGNTSSLYARFASANARSACLTLALICSSLRTRISIVLSEIVALRAGGTSVRPGGCSNSFNQSASGGAMFSVIVTA